MTGFSHASFRNFGGIANRHDPNKHLPAEQAPPGRYFETLEELESEYKPLQPQISAELRQAWKGE